MRPLSPRAVAACHPTAGCDRDTCRVAPRERGLAARWHTRGSDEWSGSADIRGSWPRSPARSRCARSRRAFVSIAAVGLQVNPTGVGVISWEVRRPQGPRLRRIAGREERLGVLMRYRPLSQHVPSTRHLPPLPQQPARMLECTYTIRQGSPTLPRRICPREHHSGPPAATVREVTAWPSLQRN